MLIVNIQTDSPIFGQLSFPQCHLLRCYQGLCNDIIEKNKDDDTDDPTDRKTERLKLFQMSTVCQKDRKTDGQTDRQKDR